MNKEDQSPAKELFYQATRYLSAGDAPKAIRYFRAAIRRDPDFAEAHSNLGLLLEQEGLTSEAEQHYRRSLALNPHYGQTYMNLGVLLFNQKRFEEAEAALKRALELTPDSASAWLNYGAFLMCRKREEEAERHFRRALALDPENRNASFNLSTVLLRQGRFEEGWRCLEQRGWYAQLEKNLPCPRWRGEPLKGRSILIGLEAGLGDMIQFCRYAALLKIQNPSRITLVCHPPLKRLFQSLDGVDEVFAVDDNIPNQEWDFWTPPLSMPYYCRTRLDSIPADIPYLHTEKQLAEKWSALLLKESTPSDLRVGLVWKGNPRFENDADRSLPHLETLASLGTIPGVRFFSLQKGQGEEDAAHPPTGLPVVNLGPAISDFADSAAIVTNLDLVICVDTAIAHLAGALGTQCWVLLPDYKTDWRWLAGRNDSPWYPRVMRLFRQTRMGDWEPVINEVHSALQQLAKRHRSARL